MLATNVIIFQLLLQEQVEVDLIFIQICFMSPLRN